MLEIAENPSSLTRNRVVEGELEAIWSSGFAWRRRACGNLAGAAPVL